MCACRQKNGQREREREGGREGHVKLKPVHGTAVAVYMGQLHVGLGIYSGRHLCKTVCSTGSVATADKITTA
jgi:hypothetical protein